MALHQPNGGVRCAEVSLTEEEHFHVADGLTLKVRDSVAAINAEVERDPIAGDDLRSHVESLACVLGLLDRIGWPGEFHPAGEGE